MKLIAIVMTCTLLSSFEISADETTYRGLIVAHIVEPNGHVYRGYEGFENEARFQEKQVIYFSQERGQKITIRDKKILVDSTTANKYHMTVQILERKGDSYIAELKFFHNTMQYQADNDEYALVSNIVKKTRIEGSLNSDNNYTFVDDNQPNLKVRMNIDKVFEKSEIITRLKEQPKQQKKY